MVKEYRGAGRVALLCAREADAERHIRRLEEAQRRIAECAAGAELRAQRAWLEAVARVVGAALERAGWHQVRRQWRKKRGRSMSAVASGFGLPWVSSDLMAAAGDLDPETEKKAAAGDPAAIAAVDAFLDDPAARALWGDMGRHVLNRWARLYAGTSEVLRQGVLRFASDLRAALAGPAPAPLERLVAERVVLAWLFANWCEVQYAAHVAECNLKQNAFHLKRIEMANRHMLAACRTLAKVKRANLPDVLALVNVPGPLAAASDIPLGP